MARPFGTKNIESPEKMWALFSEYKEEVKSNPRKKHVFVGKDGNSENEKLERPLTMEGFEVFCFDKVGTIEHYFRNDKGNYDDYCAICLHIRKLIRQDQIEGGMVGQYNPSITQRLNGLTEKVEAKNENINRNITVEVIKSDAPLTSNEKDIKID